MTQWDHIHGGKKQQLGFFAADDMKVSAQVKRKTPKGLMVMNLEIASRVRIHEIDIICIGLSTDDPFGGRSSQHESTGVYSGRGKAQRELGGKAQRQSCSAAARSRTQ